MKQSGVELIAQERGEQFTKHGRTISQDALDNTDGELAQGAKHLIFNLPDGAHLDVMSVMPKNWDKDLCAKMISKSYKERLIIAGALIAAEIDRLNLVE